MSIYDVVDMWDKICKNRGISFERKDEFQDKFEYSSKGKTVLFEIDNSFKRQNWSFRYASNAFTGWDRVFSIRKQNYGDFKHLVDISDEITEDVYTSRVSKLKEFTESKPIQHENLETAIKKNLDSVADFISEQI